MYATIAMFASTLAFTAPATVTTAPQQGPREHGCLFFGCGEGGGVIGIDLEPDIDIEVDIDLGNCFNVDIDVGASCGIIAGVEAALECNPLSVEAACIAELGADCELDAFVDCTAELVAKCTAEVEVDGALFCDGLYVGADFCLGDLDVDVDIDVDAAVEVDLGADVDLDLDLEVGACLDLDIDLGLGCYAEFGAECYAACDPLSVEAACIAELGADCDDLHLFAACQAEVLAHCYAECEAGGALFCDGGVFAGADVCLDVDLGIGG